MLAELAGYDISMFDESTGDDASNESARHSAPMLDRFGRPIEETN